MTARVPDYHAVLRAAPDLYALLDHELRIVEVSDAFLAAMKSTRSAILGRAIADVVPHDPAWHPVSSPVLDASGGVVNTLYRVENVPERVQEVRYGKLLDSAPDAIVTVGKDGRIQLVNRTAELMFGYTRQELIGAPLDTLLPERFRNSHGGHLAAYFEAPTRRLMGSRLQLYGRHMNGTELPIEVSLSPQTDERGTTVSAAIRDVTDRHRLEIAERRTADRLRSAVDSIQDAIALFDADDRLVVCNHTFLQIVHQTDFATVVGQQFSDLLEAWIHDVEFPDAAALQRFRAERLASRQHERSTFDVRMRDGRSLRVSDHRTPEGGIVKTIWDVTADEHRSVELRDARQTAEAASAAKSEFLSSMSHELRTPLNAVLGFAQLLVRDKREPLSKRHRERAEQIMRGGEHLLHLIDDVLDLAKIEEGRISISAEPVAVPDVLVEVRRTLEAIALRQGVALAVDAPPPGLPLVIADRTRLVQILLNFGSNAIKYNRSAGAVRFAVTAQDPETVRIAVIDTGHGIPRDQQSKLFQPFQRAGQETGSIEGTGIGLVITKRLAELMGGRVGFRSTPDEGSTFWVEIPAHHAVVPGPGPAVRRWPSPMRAPGTRRRLVLYVEDNPANVRFVRDLVSTLDDVELLAVPTAELGVELARAERPDLVLMDINLPGMNGFEALARLHASPETTHIPVIALTAAATARDHQHGLDAGFYRYLTKPVKVDELIEAMEAVLSPTA